MLIAVSKYFYPATWTSVAGFVKNCASRVAVTGAIVCWAAAGQAADEDGNFAIRGAGLQTCGTVIQSFDTSSADLALYAGWIDGYLTGVNQTREDTFEIAPWQTAGTLLTMVVRICRSQPENTGFMRVIVDLLREFSGTELRTQSPLTGVFNGGRRVALYEATVQETKRILAEQGYEVDLTEKEFTQQTSDALEAFQKDRGLEVTGVPDQQTLFTLFVGAAIARSQQDN